MSIVIDTHIPYLAEAVRREWPDVDIFPMEPEQIDASAIRDAEVLVVRTRTQVDESLLRGTKVQLVCTATIGFDHIDTAYCEAHGVRWMSCPGCNAQAVCDYIEEALTEITHYTLHITHKPTIGVIGVGHVGSLVAKMAERHGYSVLLNDPPKGIGISLDEIARNCDIISFHVPLVHRTLYTVHPTFHMCDEAFLAKCKPNALIVNAARGGIVDEKALLDSGHPFILDTWENEPAINPQVAAAASLASMHIAGYSEQGKRNAAQMCLDGIAEQFGLPKITLPVQTSKGDASPGWLARVSAQLKSHPDLFESLRKNYPLR